MNTASRGDSSDTRAARLARIPRDSLQGFRGLGKSSDRRPGCGWDPPEWKEAIGSAPAAGGVSDILKQQGVWLQTQRHVLTPTMPSNLDELAVHLRIPRLTEKTGKAPRYLDRYRGSANSYLGVDGQG